MTTSRLPWAAGRRADGRDALLAQREADALHASQVVGYEQGYFSSGQNCIVPSGSLTNSALTADAFVLIACRPPTKRVRISEVRFHGTTVTGTPILESAIYIYERETKRIVRLSGSDVKHLFSGTGTVTKAVDFEIAPLDTMMFLAFRRTGGTALSLRGWSLSSSLYPLQFYRQQSSYTMAFPSGVELAQFPTATLTTMPEITYLSQQVADLV